MNAAIPVLIFAWTAVGVLSLVFSGVSGFALYAAIFLETKRDSELMGQALVWYGRGLIVVTLIIASILSISGIVSAVVLGVQLIRAAASLS